MERTHNGSSDPGPRRGLAGDMRRIREGSQATAAELRDFLQNFRGKSPQEALGLVAQSGLAQGIVMSTLGSLVLLVVFTALPYAMRPAVAEQSPAKPDAAAAATPAQPAASTPQASAAAPAATAPAGAPAGAEQALEKLGETETKTADPKKNPLDNLDNLLDDAK
jgi:hypothetical protein